MTFGFLNRPKPSLQFNLFQMHPVVFRLFHVKPLVFDAQNKVDPGGRHRAAGSVEGWKRGMNIKKTWQNKPPISRHVFGCVGLKFIQFHLNIHVPSDSLYRSRSPSKTSWAFPSARPMAQGWVLVLVAMMEIRIQMFWKCVACFIGFRMCQVLNDTMFNQISDSWRRHFVPCFLQWHVRCF